MTAFEPPPMPRPRVLVSMPGETALGMTNAKAEAR
jgi:hypothetical protein